MVFPPPVRDVEGDGGETDNGMKPASMPCTPCGSREASSEKKFDIFVGKIGTPERRRHRFTYPPGYSGSVYVPNDSRYSSSDATCSTDEGLHLVASSLP